MNTSIQTFSRSTCPPAINHVIAAFKPANTRQFAARWRGAVEVDNHVIMYDKQLQCTHDISVTWHYQLEGCIVLNEHNTVFARSGPLYATGVSLGPPASSTPTASWSLQSFTVFAWLIRWQTDWQTDTPCYLVGSHRRSYGYRPVEKPNSVIVYGYNKYLLEQSTQIHHACLSFVSIHQMVPLLRVHFWRSYSQTHEGHSLGPQSKSTICPKAFKQIIMVYLIWQQQLD